jgi:hypothetical protein
VSIKIGGLADPRVHVDPWGVIGYVQESSSSPDRRNFVYLCLQILSL